MDKPTPRPARLWRIVLVVSLALNVAVVGLVAGFALRGHSMGPPARFDLSLGPVAGALSHDHRRAIARALREDGGLRRGGPAGLDALVAALRADPVDPVAVEDAARQSSEFVRRVQDRAAEALTAQILAMSAEERAALADRIEAGMQRRR